MKINKRQNRKVGDKTYWKYSINIPNHVMNDLEWDDSTEVNLIVKGKRIVIEKD